MIGKHSEVLNALTTVCYLILCERRWNLFVMNIAKLHHRVASEAIKNYSLAV